MPARRTGEPVLLLKPHHKIIAVPALLRHTRQPPQMPMVEVVQLVVKDHAAVPRRTRWVGERWFHAGGAARSASVGFELLFELAVPCALGC